MMSPIEHYEKAQSILAQIETRTNGRISATHSEMVLGFSTLAQAHLQAAHIGAMIEHKEDD